MSNITLSGNSLYDNMNNIITDSTTLATLANENLLMLAQIPGFDINSNSGITVGLNNVLTSTPLKMGCCMRKQDDNTIKIANIRIPLNPATTDPDKIKQGFDRKPLIIPAGTCPANLYKGSPDCDGFYDIYCSNVNNSFLNIYGENFDPSSYVTFAPECACYAPRTPGQQQYPPGIPPQCYKSMCANEGGASYPDPVSRSEPCNTTICSSVINTAGMKAGGVANVTPTVTQQCGYSTKTESVDAGTSNNKGFAVLAGGGLSAILNPSFLVTCIVILLSCGVVFYMTRTKTRSV